jgi:cytoskeletal protein CcmA (bactofilin family)
VVEGDIFHQSLSISEGAQFDGRVRRSKDLAEITPNLDVGSYPNTGNQTSQG